MDDYVFLVRDVFGTTYKIWADGRIEGFGPGCTIVNKIPQILAAQAATVRRNLISGDEVDCHHGCL